MAMTVPRTLFVLGLMVAVGVAIVVLRGESAKVAHRVQAEHQRQLALEQKLWAHEMELARLRDPNAIRARAREFGLEVVPPAAQSKEGAQADTGD